MAIEVKIRGEGGGDRGVEVNTHGQLVTGDHAFQIVSNVELTADDVPANLVEPVSGQIIVITAILLYANKNVLADARVHIYEADDKTTAVVKKSIFLTDVPKQTARDIVGINLEAAEGSFINAVTDDNEVFVSLFCYYTHTHSG